MSQSKIDVLCVGKNKQKERWFAEIHDNKSRYLEVNLSLLKADIQLPENGFYYKPTLITNVSTVSRVVQEEIFGPVAVAMPFRLVFF